MSKNFQLQTLKDEVLEEGGSVEEKKWENLLSPSEDSSLIISEFDCFKDFIAIYVRLNNRP